MSLHDAAREAIRAAIIGTREYVLGFCSKHLPAETFDRIRRSDVETSMVQAIADSESVRAALDAGQAQPVATSGTPYNAEGWESLAWGLCADEHGEDACGELLWEGGATPEPWGERWLKYEGEAKRLIALVRKHAPAATAPQASQPVAPSVVAALRFYAQRHHFAISDQSAWDTVSGEPQNYWCDEAGTATVEDGSIARIALEALTAPQASQPVAWSPRLDYQNYSQQRVWANGAPSQEDIDYWTKNGNGVDLAYTAPQAAQPLTDEQLDALRGDNGGQLDFVTLREFLLIARAIERAHGIRSET